MKKRVFSLLLSMLAAAALMTSAVLAAECTHPNGVLSDLMDRGHHWVSCPDCGGGPERHYDDTADGRCDFCNIAIDGSAHCVHEAGSAWDGETLDEMDHQMICSVCGSYWESHYDNTADGKCDVCGLAIDENGVCIHDGANTWDGETLDESYHLIVCSFCGSYWDSHCDGDNDSRCDICNITLTARNTCAHIDSDGDLACDACGGCPHTDSVWDGETLDTVDHWMNCSGCDGYWEGHFDANGDGSCDVCSYTPGHSICINESAGGTVTANKTAAAEGDLVTLTIIPDAGYQLKSIMINGTENSVHIGKREISLTMPNSTLEITAFFEEGVVVYFDNAVAQWSNVLYRGRTGFVQGVDIGNNTYAMIVPEYQSYFTNYQPGMPEERYPEGFLVTELITPIHDRTYTYIGFDITVDPGVTGGSLTVAADSHPITKASRGQTVTLTAIPEAGMALKSLTVTGAGGLPVPITDDQFTMPAEAVTVSAVFQPVTASLSVSAVSQYDGSTLPGALLQILNDQDAVVEEWYSSDGAYTVPGLTIGAKYTLHAALAPQGYLCPADIEFALSSTGSLLTTGAVTAEGVLLALFPPTEVAFETVNHADNSPVADAILQILDTERNVVEEWFSTQNAHVVPGLSTGVEYILKVDWVPNGYQLPDEISFALNTAGQLVSTGTITQDGVLQVALKAVPVLNNPTFNRDSDAYDSETNIFYIDDTHPLVITATGANLLGQSIGLVLANAQRNSLIFDYQTCTENDTCSFTLTAEDFREAMVFFRQYGWVEDLDKLAVMFADETTTSRITRVHVTVDGFAVTAAPAENGTVTASASTARAGQTVTLTAEPQQGYRLESLTAADLYGYPVAVTDGRFTMPACGVTVTARFAPEQKNRITWSNGEGGSYDQDVLCGTAITVPDSQLFRDTMRKTGHTLTGWTCSGDFRPGDPVPEQDLTFTAVYTANSYTVRFDTNGGGAIDPITVTYGEKYGTLPSSAITGLSGGNKNWYLVDTDGSVTDTNIRNLTKAETAADHSLFIKRTVLAPTVKITLTVPGAISDGYQYYVPGNSTRILTASVSNKNDALLDYTYQWYKDGAALDGAAEPVLTLEGNVSDTGTYTVVVTARLKPDTGILVTEASASGQREQKVKILHAANTLSYDANGGQQAPGSHYTGGAEIRVDTGEPTHEDYIFDGWNTAADGSGQSYTGGSTYTFAEDNGNGGCTVTLYAQWIAPVYAPSYPPTLQGGAHGDVRISVGNPEQGDTVTVKAEPHEGYAVDKILITDKAGNAVAVRDQGNGSYSFTQPGTPVHISVTFREADRVCAGGTGCLLHGFTDLDPAEWYHDGIHFCIERGLMQGVAPDRFDPEGVTTRAMVVTLLWRLEGSPAADHPMAFRDVAPDQWYTEAVRWAVGEKLVEGYGDGLFGTGDAITREQMVTILYRYARYSGLDLSVGENTNILSYGDALAVSEWAVPAMQWACGSGLIQGIPAGDTVNLAPQGSTTRAQSAALLQRYCEMIAE